MSCLMLSSHLYLGLPCDLLVRGFHLNIFLTVLISGILCTLWAKHIKYTETHLLLIYIFCEERKKTNKTQQSDVYYQHCPNMFRASLCPSSGEQRPCVTACDVLRWFCWMWLVAVVGRCVVGCEHCEGYCSTPSQCSHPTTQRPTTATNHIQQNQRSTPHAVTHGLCSPKDGHNDARNMLRQCW